jgi:hypothetical protein
MSERRCGGCERRLAASAFAGADGVCRRCARLRLLLWVAGDLERRQYPYAPVVRAAARLLAEVDDGGEVDRRCDECGGELPVRATGRPAVYCGGRCRKRAHRSRNRHEGRDSAHVA